MTSQERQWRSHMYEITNIYLSGFDPLGVSSEDLKQAARNCK